MQSKSCMESDIKPKVKQKKKKKVRIERFLGQINKIFEMKCAIFYIKLKFLPPMTPIFMLISKNVKSKSFRNKKLSNLKTIFFFNLHNFDMKRKRMFRGK